jgi:hypothetical protein
MQSCIKRALPLEASRRKASALALHVAGRIEHEQRFGLSRRVKSPGQKLKSGRVAGESGTLAAKIRMRRIVGIAILRPDRGAWAGIEIGSSGRNDNVGALRGDKMMRDFVAVASRLQRLRIGL